MAKHERIRVLVVDDEPQARHGVRSLLDNENDVEVVGEACDGTGAVEHIRRLRPDLVFLDIAMPGRDGLKMLGDLEESVRPDIVLVTAHDRYAVSAFECNVVDYVLKPFSDQRFRDAMERARKKLGLAKEKASSRHPLLTGPVDRKRRPLERFSVKVGDRFKVFSAEQIDWIEADEYYAKLHIGEQAYRIRKTLGSLEKQLPPSWFARIHRSTIVNVKRIDVLEPLIQGDFTVVLEDGTRLRMSRRRHKPLFDLIKTLS
jgi:two-component system LytT family response regulator